MSRVTKLNFRGVEYTVAGKGGLGVPDYDAAYTLAWGTQYTAPSDGYVLLSVYTYNSQPYLSVGTFAFELSGYDDNDGGGDAVCVPVAKDDLFRAYGSYSSIRVYAFIPAKATLSGSGGGGGSPTVVIDQSLNTTSTNPVTNAAITTAINTKQDTISDLATIRDGAAAGATALQSVPAATSTTLGGVILEYDASTNTLNIKTS